MADHKIDSIYYYARFWVAILENCMELGQWPGANCSPDRIVVVVVVVVIVVFSGKELIYSAG